MKKLAIVSALAATLSTAAMAQSSVSIYGMVDVGVLNASHVGAANGNATQVLSSPMNTSRLGFTGTEDLGGGLKSGFKLEAQINPADGSQGISSSTGVANGTFSRGANVFLESASAGRLTLGRQDNAAFQAFNYGDVNAAKNFGGSIIFWNDGSSFGGGATKTGLTSFTGTTFLSNAIRYDTPKFGGFRGTLQHVAGGQADGSTLGNTSASNRTVVTALYDQGPWGAALGYSTANGATSQENARVISAGVNYTQEKFKLATGYTKFQNPNSTAANTDFNLYQVSGRYNVTNKFSTSVGYYVLNDQVTTANKTKMLSLIGNYELSKRTELYAGVASTVNDGASGFAPYGAGAANLNSMNATQYPSIMQTAGQTQNGYVVGMTHRF